MAGAPSLSGFGTIAHPYIQVTITQPVQQSFAKLITRTSNVNTGATAICGLNPVAVPVPLVVLHQTAVGSLSKTGAATITILGGPNRSIQVDSSNAGAVSSGGSGNIDLSAAGPLGTGADFGVFGQEVKPSNVVLGAGKWVSPGGPLGDPWATVAAPPVPTSVGMATAVGFSYHGCPDPSGCVEFTGGDYRTCSTGTITSGGNACLMLKFGGSNPKFSSLTGNRTPSPTTYTLGQVVQPSSWQRGKLFFQATGVIAPGRASATANPLAWPQTIGNHPR